MKEINLAAVINEKRREKGVTQDELAAYIGVTKASVSKWETGQSYPDVTFLPILAAYFDISIDRLMGYSPQLEPGDIKKLYRRLAADFAKKPFEEVMAECESIVRKYYSCYPLLWYMAQLYVNHAPMAENQERREQILTTAAQLCVRVKENCGDAHLIRNSILLQAYCCLSLGDGKAVLELFEEPSGPVMPEGALISQAYRLLGNAEKAKEVLQTELYQSVAETFNTLINLLHSNFDCIETAEKIYLRAENLAELFNMRRLNPNSMVNLYALGAQMYQLGGFPEKAIETLSKYVDVCVHGFFPIKARGDDFFDRIDRWLNEIDEPIPRNDAVIKESMLKDILYLPVFEPLREYPEFNRIVKKLKDFINLS